VSTVVSSRTLAVSGRGALLRTCVGARITWTIATILVVQAFVCGAALFPVVMIWWLLLELTRGAETLRGLVISLAVVPSYVLFALLLMFVSALSVRALNWRTPADTEARIADFDWPVLTWARAMAATHLVRFAAGALFRASPVWTAYLRLAGARLGRRVYVNSLAVTDYDLLEFGDDVVIGSDAHVSGHTVEGGVLKTARLRLGNGVTIGVGSIIEIGVEAGDGCQVGALSFVAKHTRLAPGVTYAGIPAAPIADAREST
jgi:acetyltransferase-like isoleucine patch superfamily enzyme